MGALENVVVGIGNIHCVTEWGMENRGLFEGCNTGYISRRGPKKLSRVFWGS